MSLIEQAAKRLEELRKAGIDYSGSGQAPTNTDLPKGLKQLVPVENAAAPIAVPPKVRRQDAPATDDPRHTAQDLSANDIHAAARRLRPRFDLDLAKLALTGFVTPDMPRSRIADEFRVLKRPLLGNTSGERVVPIKHANLIMVTSSVPGEGKTSHLPVYVWRAVARGYLRPETSSHCRYGQAVAICQTNFGAHQNGQPAGHAVGVQTARAVWH